MEAGREEIARAEAAAVLTVGKSCGGHRNLGSPKSSARTALEDLREIPVEAITDDRHHRALDKVAAHKDRMCEPLRLRRAPTSSSPPRSILRRGASNRLAKTAIEVRKIVESAFESDLAYSVFRV